MLDLKLLRKDPDIIEKKLQGKDPSIKIKPILELDDQIRKTQAEIQDKKAVLNATSKKIGLMKKNNEDTSAILNEMTTLSEEITLKEKDLKENEQTRFSLLACLPNIPFDDVPHDLDPANNVCIKTFKEKPTFSFPFKNHLELNENLHLFDFKRSVKISGSGWPMYTDMGARLEWALLNYMIDTHRKNGFTQIMPPLLAKPEIMFGCGQLPKFEEQLFKIHDKDYQLYLIPTAEATLNGYFYDEILKEEDLPKKFIAYTPCFRREAGAAGKQERGLIRTHQFNKVEMFAFTKPEESCDMLQTMMDSAEEILQGLNLHYRNMLLVSGDCSFGSAKTIDIEVWLPGQDRYYEVSSVSNCTDFQSRRSKTRYKNEGDKPEFVHTLNGSGLATSRLMVALLENNQNEDGSIDIPKVLHPYLSGITKLTPQ